MYQIIKTKSDLQRFLLADLRGDKPPKWWRRFFGSEEYPVYAHKKNLRYLEFYQNNRDKSIIHKLLYNWHLFTFNRRRLRLNIYIQPNVFGPGLTIIHQGFRRADTWVHVGENCTLLPNVIFAKKSPELLFFDVVVGDNVYIGTNVTVLAPCKIGSNVTIGAGSVVTKDMPTNAIVAGVPAKIIRFK